MLTAQDVVDVYVWIGLREELPSADDTRCRIDKCAVHIKQPLCGSQGSEGGERKGRRTGHLGAGWCQAYCLGDCSQQRANPINRKYRVDDMGQMTGPGV